MAINFDRYKRYDTSKGYGDKTKWRRAFSDRMSGQEAAEIISSQRESTWTILGLAEGATQAEIKKAFRQKISEWHPDKNPHRLEEAEEMSKKIIAAYTLLTQ